ncbi:hypothetical protein M9H77_20944 [Catharanthus roseus]|uniref:Uncharacterized protein n=1 Tax=Catharanthus roseus TaxID=4058 RepID=A0ACC0AQ51_CATRO|nr:hypothetical protein M9H77_20944 [Catharanthus roseus]
MITEVVEEETMSVTRSSSSSSSSPSSYTNDIINDHESKQLPLLALNHVSFICKSVSKSVKFYEEVLGFLLIKRPSSFDFEGAWLFNHGMGIHLLEVEEIKSKKKKEKINPKDNHISFQTPNMDIIMEKLDEMKIEYVTAVVKEGGITVDQLFFHDPDGYMIEICNCQNLPVLPLSASAAAASSCPVDNTKFPRPTKIQSQSSFFDNFDGNYYGPSGAQVERVRGTLNAPKK